MRNTRESSIQSKYRDDEYPATHCSLRICCRGSQETCERNARVPTPRFRFFLDFVSPEARASLSLIADRQVSMCSIVTMPAQRMEITTGSMYLLSEIRRDNYRRRSIIVNDSSSWSTITASMRELIFHQQDRSAVSSMFCVTKLFSNLFLLLFPIIFPQPDPNDNLTRNVRRARWAKCRV